MLSMAALLTIRGPVVGGERLEGQEPEGELTRGGCHKVDGAEAGMPRRARFLGVKRISSPGMNWVGTATV
jgi:hypothetical protein